MGITIRLRRGTKAQLNTLMSTTPMLDGEIGYTTDTKEVYISDGSSIHLVGKVIVDVLSNRPTAGVSGRIFLATDNGLTYIDNGASWQAVSVANLDSIADGTTYGKVKLSELDDGYVKQIRTSAIGDILTASGIKSHIDDATKHREINDSTTTSTSLWSSQKVNSTINTAITGLDFQSDVINKQTDATLDPGATPTSGDRYIISNASALHANFGAISGIGNNDIVSYNGSAFVVVYDVSVVGEGAIVWNRTSNYFEKYDGSSWSEFGGLSGVTAGDGLTKLLNVMNVGAGDGIDVAVDSVSVDVTDLIGTGLSEDASNNLRIGAQGDGFSGGDGSLLSILADTTSSLIIAPVSVTVSGVGVKIDNDSLNHTTGTIKVVKIDGGTF